MTQRRDALREDQWQRIKDFLPGREWHVDGTAKDNRLFVEAVLYRYRAGIAWRDLPERFGDFRVIHTRHTRWSTRGVWQRIFERLAENAVNEYAMIDSAIVHAHQHAAGAKGGGGKRNARIDDKNPYVVRCAGQATGFHLTPGHAHDLEGADRLLPHLLERIQAFLAGKAYDAQERVLDLLAKAGVTPAIPPTSHRTQQRDYDQDLYQARPLIENFFAKLKHDRAIATRYDKRAHTFLGAIYLAASVIWLN